MNIGGPSPTDAGLVVLCCKYGDFGRLLQNPLTMHVLQVHRVALTLAQTERSKDYCIWSYITL
jgi:hypothetical protein